MSWKERICTFIGLIIGGWFIPVDMIGDFKKWRRKYIKDTIRRFWRRYR